MPKKKPFSNKQKKKQLQEKRHRKQGEKGDKDGSIGSASDSEVEAGPKSVSANKSTQRGPSHQNKKHDRYKLQLQEDTPVEIEKRKQQARLPIEKLPENCLEFDLDLELCPEIPKRPSWNYKLSKQQLERNEETYFKEYLAKLNKWQDELGRGLGYYERNLETWRQLWRVLEMSDVFLMITDIRHPTVTFSPSLYNYISTELKKPIVLILNKADLAPPSLVVAWQHFFKSKFPLVNVVLFTSYPKDKQELETSGGEKNKAGVTKRRKRLGGGRVKALGPRHLMEVCQSLVQDRVKLESWRIKIENDEDFTSEETEEVEQVEDGISQESSDNNDDHNDHPDSQEAFKDGVLTIGCVGYPNVGKSSVINGLMGKKVVSVSRTPGHTKHFQTIYLTSNVRLCDCPGLVLPAVIDRNTQVQ